MSVRKRQKVCCCRILLRRRCRPYSVVSDTKTSLSPAGRLRKPVTGRVRSQAGTLGGGGRTCEARKRVRGRGNCKAQLCIFFHFSVSCTAVHANRHSGQRLCIYVQGALKPQLLLRPHLNQLSIEINRSRIVIGVYAP